MATATLERTPTPHWWQRLLVALPSIAVMLGVLLVIRASLGFLTDDTAPRRVMIGLYRALGMTSVAEAVETRGLSNFTERGMVAIVALVVGVGGVWALFIAANFLIDRALPLRWRDHIRPWVFVGPALALVGAYLLVPALITLYLSATADGGFLSNYQFALTSHEAVIALRNNVIWLAVGTSGSVVIGLAFAALVDRIKREALAKTFIFLPLAISFIGASIIWRFVYAWDPPGQPQIGLLNAFLGNFGVGPIDWLRTIPINNLLLIIIMIWLQTGFAMVILSAALKGVPGEVIEAGRIDGASELQLFFRVILPMIRPTTITVATTIFIAILKVFDIVFVLTNGNFDTQVVANRMYREMFVARADGRASALAVVLLLAVLPILYINIRNMREQGLGS